MRDLLLAVRLFIGLFYPKAVRRYTDET